MKEKSYEFSVQTNSLSINSKNGENKNISVLELSVSGKPQISMVTPVMKAIRKEADKMNEPYLSTSDLRNLKIGNFLEKLIKYGLKLPFKKLLSISTPSKISFIYLNENQIKNTSIVSGLKQIDADIRGGKREYNYMFVESKKEMLEIVQKLVDRGDLAF